LSDRWWRRKRRHDQWFNDSFNEVDKIEKDFDEMIHRAFRNPMEEERTRRRYSSQLAGQPLSQPFSSRINELNEPLVDVFVDEDYVVVVVELLGADRNSIDLHATESKLMISVDLLGRRYSREIDLPARVDAKSSISTLKNGVLEVRLRKLGEKLVIR